MNALIWRTCVQRRRRPLLQAAAVLLPVVMSLGLLGLQRIRDFHVTTARDTFTSVIAALDDAPVAALPVFLKQSGMVLGLQVTNASAAAAAVLLGRWGHPCVRSLDVTTQPHHRCARVADSRFEVALIKHRWRIRVSLAARLRLLLLRGRWFSSVVPVPPWLDDLLCVLSQMVGDVPRPQCERCH